MNEKALKLLEDNIKNHNYSLDQEILHLSKRPSMSRNSQNVHLQNQKTQRLNMQQQNKAIKSNCVQSMNSSSQFQHQGQCNKVLPISFNKSNLNNRDEYDKNANGNSSRSSKSMYKLSHKQMDDFHKAKCDEWSLLILKDCSDFIKETEQKRLNEEMSKRVLKQELDEQLHLKIQGQQKERQKEVAFAKEMRELIRMENCKEKSEQQKHADLVKRQKEFNLQSLRETNQRTLQEIKNQSELDQTFIQTVKTQMHQADSKERTKRQTQKELAVLMIRENARLKAAKQKHAVESINEEYIMQQDYLLSLDKAFNEKQRIQQLKHETTKRFLQENISVGNKESIDQARLEEKTQKHKLQMQMDQMNEEIQKQKKDKAQRQLLLASALKAQVQGVKAQKLHEKEVKMKEAKDWINEANEMQRKDCIKQSLHKAALLSNAQELKEQITQQHYDEQGMTQEELLLNKPFLKEIGSESGAQHHFDRIAIKSTYK